MTAKKKVTKKVPAKKAAKKIARKSPANKAAAKKTAAKKPPGKKKPVKKAATKKAPAKKAPAKTPPAQKAPVKKAPVKKAPVKKVAEDTPIADQAPAKKADTGKPETKGKAGANAPSSTAPPKMTGKPAKPVKLTVFVQRQRKNLLDLRDQLMDAMYGVQQETLRKAAEGNESSGSGMHQGDAGSDAYDRDFALNMLSKEQDALQEIEAALERIAKGVYGICEMSGKKIPQPRLEAIPFARLTVKCQTRWEKECPQRQFRSEDPVAKAMMENNGSAVSLDEQAK